MQTTFNPSEPQSESLFNYHQVFRENYHNVQQKGDKQVNNFMSLFALRLYFKQRRVQDFFHQGQIHFYVGQKIYIMGRIAPERSVLNLLPLPRMRACFIRGRNILFQILSEAYLEGGICPS